MKNRRRILILSAVLLLIILLLIIKNCSEPDKSDQRTNKKVEPPNYKNMELMEVFKLKSKSDKLPDKIVFIALKEERILEVWFQKGKDLFYINEFPILAASGKQGPKLKEGDKQVPEGFYKIILLNPLSSYHLSMKLNYPNEFDQKIAQKEQRTDIGSEIYIHGKAVSIGCLAMGDKVIEKLYNLVQKVGMDKCSFIISPCDLRRKKISLPENRQWVKELYADIEKKLRNYSDKR